MRLSHPVEQLLSDFKAGRRLRVGSLIITVFGDALAPRGGAITLGSLISLLATFDVSERLTRTSVGRLAEDSWLRCERAGRLSEYHLSDSGRSRFAEATRRIYAGPPAAGGDCWTMVTLPPAAQGERQQLRSALRLGGYGEINEGVYAHPYVTPKDTIAYLRDQGIEDPLVFESRLVGDIDPATLVSRAWDLTTLGQRYCLFCEQFTPLAKYLTKAQFIEPAVAFLVRTLLVHEYRRIHLRDPMVPASLLPADYPGHEAYELSRQVYHTVFLAAECHLDAVARRFEGQLPPPDDAARQRFPDL
jgi:phenylacetic acid degradation operon negative regulatory protein